MTARRIVVSILAALFVTGVARSQSGSADEQAEKLYQKGYKAVLGGSWNEAKAAFEEVLRRYPKHISAEASQYWLCHVGEKLGEKPENTFECYESFVEKYHGSKWADDARAEMIRLGHQLAKGGEPEYEARIRALEQAGDEQVRLAALYALRQSNSDEAIAAIVDLYRSSRNPNVRRDAVHVLGTITTEKSLATLATIAQHDSSPEVRVAAVYGLAQSEDRAALASLKQIVQGPSDREVKRAAIYALAKSKAESADVRSGAVPILASIAQSGSDSLLARDAIYALGAIGGEESKRALEKCVQDARHPEVARAALFALGNRSDGLDLAVIKDVALHNPDTEMRQAAIYVIARHGGEESAKTKALKEILASSHDDATRQVAVSALASTHSPETREILLDLALNGPGSQTALAAVYGLASLRAKSETFLTIVKGSKYPEATRAALYQLASASDSAEGKNIVPSLARIAKEEKDPELREAVAMALGMTRSDEAVGILTEIATSDENTRVRTAAVRALSQIGTPKAQKALVGIIQGKKSP